MAESSPIRVNQTGYAASLPVHAAVLSGGPVRLAGPDGKTIRELTLEPPRVDAASGDPVALVSLGLLPPGVYRLEAGGAERTLTVSARPWTAVTRALIKGFYYQRCGCALRAEHAGPYTHAACHTAPAAEWERRGIVRRIAGGWHDAGDYGKYTGPGAVAAAHLMYAWKLFPAGCPDPLDIPETGSGLPDILSEVLYELRWLLQMQRADGAFHHKLTKALFAPFIMPEDDRAPEYLMPVSHCATAAACACLALAGRIYGPFGADLARQMLAAALRGWDWLEAHPDFAPFQNPEGVRTGQYGDRSDRDERFWAACELLAATGEARFREAAEALFEGQNLTRFGWADVGGLGALCCLSGLDAGTAGPVLGPALRDAFLRQSEDALALSRLSGYGTALAPDRYVWGSTLPILSHAMAMIVNSLLTGRQDMRAAALLQWDYALGMNALDTCLVTGFGERPIMRPHHRPSAADGVDAPVPGLISGGPNARYTYPDAREAIRPGTPPAKCLADVTGSPDTNEIAIYWNSPAAFVGAYFNQP